MFHVGQKVRIVGPYIDGASTGVVEELIECSVYPVLLFIPPLNWRDSFTLDGFLYDDEKDKANPSHVYIRPFTKLERLMEELD